MDFYKSTVIQKTGNKDLSSTAQNAVPVCEPAKATSLLPNHDENTQFTRKKSVGQDRTTSASSVMGTRRRPSSKRYSPARSVLQPTPLGATYRLLHFIVTPSSLLRSRQSKVPSEAPELCSAEAVTKILGTVNRPSAKQTAQINPVQQEPCEPVTPSGLSPRETGGYSQARQESSSPESSNQDGYTVQGPNVARTGDVILLALKLRARCRANLLNHFITHKFEVKLCTVIFWSKFSCMRSYAPVLFPNRIRPRLENCLKLFSKAHSTLN